MLRWLAVVGVVWVVAGLAVALLLGRLAHEAPPAPTGSAPEPRVPAGPALPWYAAVVSHGARTSSSVLVGGLAALRSGDVAPEDRDQLLDTLEHQASLIHGMLEGLLATAPPELVRRLDRLPAEQLEAGWVVGGTETAPAQA